MIKRSFRVFGLKDDLQAIFTEFQESIDVYYVPAYSDNGPLEISDITKIEPFGINLYGSHIGNAQFRVLQKSKKCVWREFQSKKDEKMITRYTSLCEENEENIDIDLGGVFNGNCLFATTISSMHYERESSKRLFDEIKRISRRLSVKTIDGYLVCSEAYVEKEGYRFCKIDFKSPKDYDLVL